MNKRDVQDLKARVLEHEHEITHLVKLIVWHEDQRDVLLRMIDSWEDENGDSGPPLGKPNVCPYE